jgi:hypothetical protein
MPFLKRQMLAAQHKMMEAQFRVMEERLKVIEAGLMSLDRWRLERNTVERYLSFRIDWV